MAALSMAVDGTVTVDAAPTKAYAAVLSVGNAFTAHLTRDELLQLADNVNELIEYSPTEPADDPDHATDIVRDQQDGVDA